MENKIVEEAKDISENILLQLVRVHHVNEPLGWRQKEATLQYEKINIEANVKDTARILEKMKKRTDSIKRANNIK